MGPGTDPAVYRAADLRGVVVAVGSGPVRSAAEPPRSGGSGYEGAERAGWSSPAVWNSMRSTRTPATDSTSRRDEHRLNCQESNDCRWAITEVRVGSAPGGGGSGPGGRFRWSVPVVVGLVPVVGSGGRFRWVRVQVGSGSGDRYGFGDLLRLRARNPPRWSVPGAGVPVLVRGRGLGPIGSAPGAGPRTVRGGERPSTGCDGPFGGSTSTAEPCWRSWSDPLARRA